MGRMNMPELKELLLTINSMRSIKDIRKAYWPLLSGFDFRKQVPDHRKQFHSRWGIFGRNEVEQTEIEFVVS